MARLGVIATFPAKFTLVLAANPCPCAKMAGPAEGCSCSPATRRRYLGRISGPLLDRVDVKIELEPVGRRELLNDRTFAESSRTVALRVIQARERAAHRLRGTPWRLNAEIPGSELRRTWPPAPGSLAAVERSLDRGQISARGVVKVVRVAWTLADLAGPAPSHPRRLRRGARPVARGAAVSSGGLAARPPGEEKLARAALTYLAEPGDPALGALLAICSPAEVLAAIKADMLPGTGPGCGDTPASRAALDRALGRWRARLPGLPDDERPGGHQPRRHQADLPRRCRMARRARPARPGPPVRAVAARTRGPALRLLAFGVHGGVAGRHQLRRARGRRDRRRPRRTGLDGRLGRSVRHRRRRAPRRAGRGGGHDRGAGVRGRLPLPGGARGPVRRDRRARAW